jgi:hypothetical protein
MPETGQELPEMVEQEANDTTEQEAATAPSAPSPKRIYSEVGFPYSDLESALGLAQAINEHTGGSCQDKELAAWLNQSADGGTYKSRRSAARMFGLIDVQAGTLSLTSLGRDALDNLKGRTGRVDAFLKPELFRVLYQNMGGHALPPAAAIERQMEEAGVSPKQKERARQVFQKSAVYAGFIDPGTGRFVKPGSGASTQGVGTDQGGKAADRLGGSGGGGPNDPLIAALIQKLPNGGQWPAADRVIWLKMATMAFDLAYGRDGDIEIKASKPLASTVAPATAGLLGDNPA